MECRTSDSGVCFRFVPTSAFLEVWMWRLGGGRAGIGAEHLAQRADNRVVVDVGRERDWRIVRIQRMQNDARRGFPHDLLDRERALGSAGRSFLCTTAFCKMR